MARKLELSGATVLLTGAASGIGAAAAEVLVARGARVALIDVDDLGLSRLSTQLGERTRSFTGSVTDADRLAEITAEVLAWTGRVDVVWANAGISAEPVATISSIEPAVFERVVEVDLLGVWRTIRAALPAVREASGHVLMTSSTYAFANGMVNAPYAASKAAVESLGRSLRAELAGTGTTAGVLFPGWVETPIVRTSRHDDPVAKRLTGIGFPGPLGRLITPEKLAEAAVRGIERRAPRTVYPRSWLGWAWLRGLINPVLDFGIDRHRTVHGLVREIDARPRPTVPRGRS